MRNGMKRAAFAALAATVLAAGCGGGDDGGSATTQAERPEPKPKPAPPRPPAAQSAVKAQLWFTAGEQFHQVERELPGERPAAEEAVEALLAGPQAGDAAGGVPAETQIPPGVALERFALDSGTGTAEVQLSQNFLEGIPADPETRDLGQRTDLNARLGQVTYTVTQFDGVDFANVRVGRTLVNPDLERAEYAKPAAVAPPVTKPAGKKLPGTRAVQARLAKLGYLPKAAVDGRAGYWTSQAVMAFQAWQGLGRDGVVGPLTAAELRTATRPIPQAGGPAKRIEVSNEKGVALLIKGNKVKRAIHVSTGAPGTETPPGRFTVFRKELNSWSVPFQTWLPFASYFNAGIAFHEYAEVPPYPASHGCVRVPAPEAKQVYAFAAMGTTIVVI
jgi:peptidoglycan hydrolase-like protein with peptidoglycan-binding domain